MPMCNGHMVGHCFKMGGTASKLNEVNRMRRTSSSPMRNWRRTSSSRWRKRKKKKRRKDEMWKKFDDLEEVVLKWDKKRALEETEKERENERLKRGS